MKQILKKEKLILSYLTKPIVYREKQQLKKLIKQILKERKMPLDNQCLEDV